MCRAFSDSLLLIPDVHQWMFPVVGFGKSQNPQRFMSFKYKLVLGIWFRIDHPLKWLSSLVSFVLLRRFADVRVTHFLLLHPLYYSKQCCWCPRNCIAKVSHLCWWLYRDSESVQEWERYLWKMHVHLSSQGILVKIAYRRDTFFLYFDFFFTPVLWRCNWHIPLHVFIYIF